MDSIHWSGTSGSISRRVGSRPPNPTAVEAFHCGRRGDRPNAALYGSAGGSPAAANAAACLRGDLERPFRPLFFRPRLLLPLRRRPLFAGAFMLLGFPRRPYTLLEPRGAPVVAGGSSKRVPLLFPSACCAAGAELATFSGELDRSGLRCRLPSRSRCRGDGDSSSLVVFSS